MGRTNHWHCACHRHFSPIIAASGLAVAGLGEIIQEEMKRREFRKKVPMSVFIDLERK
jgi:hypothetical protein